MVDKSTEKILDSFYKNAESPAAFSGINNLWIHAKNFIPKIKRNEVEAYLAKQSTYTKHRKAIRKFQRLKTHAPGPYTIWQADLGIMNMLTSQNSGYAYYLLCIDCFTRKIFVQPIKKKTAQ
jgi:hypothetical protein